jgi:hypothetical protein
VGPEGSLPCHKGPPLFPVQSHMNPVHTSYTVSVRSILVLRLFTLPRGLIRKLCPFHTMSVSGMRPCTRRDAYLQTRRLVSTRRQNQKKKSLSSPPSIVVFWIVTPCGLKDLTPEGEGDIDLRNVGNHLQYYTP